jgi:hypothetical protein
MAVRGDYVHWGGLSVQPGFTLKAIADKRGIADIDIVAAPAGTCPNCRVGNGGLPIHEN